MRIWKTKKLVDEIARDALSERDKATYFVFTAVAWTSASLIPNPEPWTRFDNLRFVSLAITILGYVLCFRVNHSAEGRSFIERTVLLSVPITVRTFVVMFFVLLIARAVSPSLAKHPAFWPIAANLITGYFFWRLWSSFTSLAELIRRKPALSPPQTGSEPARLPQSN
jgi:hypothetical protein